MPSDDTLPPFKPDVPTEVYADLFQDEKGISPTRRFLVENAAETAREIRWLVDHQKESGKVLEEIKLQCIRTNGRVTKLEEEVVKLKENRTENKAEVNKIRDDIKLVVIAQKLASTKWFWIGLFVFLFGLYSLLVNAEFIKSLPILKSLLGG